MARSSARKGPSRRSAILEAAERLFRHYGIGKTTIGDVARECGIGVGSVYLEFESKDSIVSELASRRHESVLGAMKRAAETRGTYAERLSAALEARIEALFALNSQGAHSCDLVLCPSSAVKTAYGRFRNEELEFVAGLLEEGTRAGELAVEDPRRTAELIQRAYVSFSPPGLFEQDRRRVLAQVRDMNRLLLRGLRRP
jgi:AcrR family transcriptional regulator